MLDSEFFGGLERPRAAVSRPNSLAALEVCSTGRAVGGEIRGVDLSQPIPSDLAAALREAWLDPLILLFHGQYLDAAHYLDAARIFGPG